MTLFKEYAILVITMKVIERTKDGIWYESSDGTEHYLDSQEITDMLELLDVNGEDTNVRRGLL